MTTNVSHGSTPTPASASKPRYLAATPSKAATTATETRHDDIVGANTHSAVRDAAQSIGGVPPRPADTSARDRSR